MKVVIAIFFVSIMVDSSGQSVVFAGTLGADTSVTESKDALVHLDADFYMQDGFSTDLPVVMLGEDDSAGIFLEYREMTADVLQEGTVLSGVYREQWKEKASKGKPEREKSDYYVTMNDESRQVLESSLWDRKVSKEWLLLGNMYDKSLLRNYLALTLAEELDISQYEVQYCELFVEDDGRYLYQGVYLLAAPAITEEDHLQRGDYQTGKSKALSTYAAQNDILGNGLYVPSMYSLDDETFKEMEERIDLAEQSIFSSDYNTFSKYENYLELTNVYDYFILYELFGNASAGHLAHYLYDSQEGKFWPVAQADFEYSIDNEQQTALAADDFDMLFTPYYQPLCKSINFVNGLQERYQELVLDLLKSSNLDIRIDEIAAGLGDSQIRDWARWEDVYRGDDMYTLVSEEPDGENESELNRNTYSYSQEINKVKFTLRHHGNTMFGSISELYEQKNMTGNDAGYVTNTLLFLAFLAVIGVTIYIVSRRLR